MPGTRILAVGRCRSGTDTATGTFCGRNGSVVGCLPQPDSDLRSAGSERRVHWFGFDAREEFILAGDRARKIMQSAVGACLAYSSGGSLALV